MADITINKEQLLRCLKAYCYHEQIDFPADSVFSAIPLDEGRISIPNFKLVAERLNLTLQDVFVMNQKLENLENPSIVLNKDGECYLILGIDYTTNIATIYNPLNEVIKTENVSLSDLNEVFSGHYYALLTDVSVEIRTNLFIKSERGENWFKETLKKLKNAYPAIITGTILINLLAFVVPIAIMNIYDLALPNRATNTLWAFAIGAMIFLLFDLLLKVLRGVILTDSTFDINDELAQKLFKHSLNLKLGNKYLSAGSYIQTSNELLAVRDFYTTATIISLVDLPFFILYLTGIYLIAGPLFLVPLIGVILVFLFNLGFQPLIEKGVRTNHQANTQQQAIQMEAINSVETIKALAAELIFEKRFNNTMSIVRENRSDRYYMQFSNNLSSFLSQLFSIVLIIYGGYLFFDNSITMGALVASSLLASRAMGMARISQLLFEFKRMMSARENIKKVLEAPVDFHGEKSYFYKDNLLGNIDFRGVTYTYPGQPHEALHQISLSIKAGEKVGILGGIGAGKTTLLKLIVDFLDPDMGTISIDDIDARELDPYLLRSSIHYMPSEVQLFYGTIKDNIKLGNPAATSEEILMAAQLTGVVEFIKDDPRGFDMIVAERGANLSAGQRQAVCLARAVVSKAKTLLLDEPTSYIDYVHAKQFMEHVFKALADKTIILVTHRPSLFKYVDRVIQIEKGIILQDGPREKVMAEILKQENSHLGLGDKK